MSVNTIPSLLASFLERLEAGISGGEALSLELKRAEQSLPKRIWPTVSAFANTCGGWIILGIDASQNPVAITGIPRAADMLQSFRNQSRNRQKVSVETCGARDAAVEVLDDKEIIVLRIRAASRKQRPVYSTAIPMRGPTCAGMRVIISTQSLKSIA